MERKSSNATCSGLVLGEGGKREGRRGQGSMRLETSLGARGDVHHWARKALIVPSCADEHGSAGHDGWVKRVVCRDAWWKCGVQCRRRAHLPGTAARLPGVGVHGESVRRRRTSLLEMCKAKMRARVERGARSTVM
eukprot:363396-Chlamydomonas_euryale.AAC.7